MNPLFSRFSSNLSLLYRIHHIVSNPDRTIDIEKLYESLYNEYKEIYANSEIARIYALDDLYDLKIFDYESR